MKDKIITAAETSGCEGRISIYRKAAAVCFGVLAANDLINLFVIFRMYAQENIPAADFIFSWFFPNLISCGIYVLAFFGSLNRKSGHKLLFASFSVYLLRRVYILLKTVYTWAEGIRIGLNPVFPAENVVWIIEELVIAAAMVIMLFVLLTGMCDRFSSRRTLARKLWFLPGLLAVSILLRELNTLISVGRIEFPFAWVLSQILNVAFISGLLLTAAWVTLPQSSCSAAGGKGKFDMVIHVLMLLFTFGIWHCIWIYRTTVLLNCVEKEPRRSPAKKLLLCIFVPFYIVYWVYISSKRIDRLAERNDKEANLTVPCTVLALFAGIVPPIIMQEKINGITLSE